MASQDPTIQRLRAAIADGRTANIRYRQNELQNLHKTLTENANSFADAISQDTGATSAEVEAELFLTLDSLRHFYDGLDFQKEMKDEYAVANGVDNLERRIGAGLVVVRPTSHTRLYSVVAPISAAVAAGNCILLELEQTTLNIDTLLKSLLVKALDNDTFGIATKSVPSQSLPAHILLDQTSPSSLPISKTNELVSSTSSRTLAIVDRTANVDAAAQAIVTARFSFQGTSPYAPDLVIVNEWVKKDFFEACIKYTTQLVSSKGSVKPSSLNSSKETAKAIKDAESKGQLSTFGGRDFKIVDISDRSSPLTSVKVSGFYLSIVQCSSITDAVFSQDTSTTFLAGYFFADPSAAKFISQHLDCHMTFVNQIPTQLLVGPASPLTHAPSYPYRYTTDMFSVPRPQFTSPSKSKSVIPVTSILSLASEDKISSKDVRKLSMKPLKSTGQGKGEAIGFFEQGIITGGVILFGVVVPAMGYASWVLGRKGWELARRWK